MKFYKWQSMESRTQWAFAKKFKPYYDKGLRCNEFIVIYMYSIIWSRKHLGYQFLLQSGKIHSGGIYGRILILWFKPVNINLN